MIWAELCAKTFLTSSLITKSRKKSLRTPSLSSVSLILKPLLKRLTLPLWTLVQLSSSKSSRMHLVCLSPFSSRMKSRRPCSKIQQTLLKLKIMPLKTFASQSFPSIRVTLTHTCLKRKWRLTMMRFLRRHSSMSSRCSCKTSNGSKEEINW